MTVISFVGAALLVACTVSISSFGSVKMQRVLDDHSLIPKRAVPAGFVEIGCYRLNTIKNREGLGTYTSKDISIVMEKCSKNAELKGHHFFGIKRKKGNNKYMCVTGEIKNAKRAKRCNKKIGGRSSVFMYYNKKPVPEDFVEIDCYRLNTIKNREDLGTYTSKDISIVMENCNKNAELKGHHFFGIKRKRGNNKYMCVTGEIIYAELEKSCNEKIGGRSSVFMYYTKRLECGEKKPGESWYIRGKTWETNHEDCVLCHCDDVLNKMSCEEITCCEPKCNSPVIPEGKCCPECQGQESSEGCRAEETTTPAPTAIPIHSGPDSPTTYSFKYW